MIAWLLVLLGCGAEPKQLTAEGCDAHLTVPAGLREVTDLHGSAPLQAAAPTAPLYVIAMCTPTPDMTLHEYADAAATAITGQAPASQPVDRPVGGMDAAHHQVRAEFEGELVVFHVTAIEGPKRYHQVVIWTVAGQHAAQEPVINSIIDSFRLDP